MKKIFSVSILLVCVLALGFVFVGCGGGGDDTYSAIGFQISPENFTSVFSLTATTDLQYFSGDPNTLRQKMEANKSKFIGTPTDGKGLKYSEIDSELQSYVSQSAITSDEKNDILGKLKSDGWVGAYKVVSGVVGVVGAIKE